MPDSTARAEAVNRFTLGSLAPDTEAALARAFDGLSYSEIESALQRALRASALGYGTLEECAADACAEHIRRLKPGQRRGLAVSLVGDLGLSQHRAHRLTGVSRDTIRKALRTQR